MRLLFAALGLPRRLCAVAWTYLWQLVCPHPVWSNPDIIGGFGDPIYCRRCLRCGYPEASRGGRRTG